MLQARSPLLAFDGLADGRSHGRCAMAVRTDIARIHCLDYSCYCPPACHRLPARRRLADFMDGFGGGTTRERTLAIMKDSHIGSYGVIGLIFYFLLLLQMRNLPLNFLCILVFCGDCWSKFCASQLINYLPYARKEEDSKAKVVYNRMSRKELISAFVCGLIPFVLLLPIRMWPATLFPLLTFALLCRLMKRRLQGYTGDCCGAAFLLCELSFYIGSLIMVYIYAGYGIDFLTKYVSVPFYFH